MPIKSLFSFLKRGDVGSDFRVIPVGGADELAADHAVLVDDVGFGKLEGAVEHIGRVLGITHGEQVDVVVANELLVGAVVGVLADGENRHLVAQILLELDQRWHLFDAGRAPRRPEVEQHGLTPKLRQRDRLVGIGEREIGCRLVDLGRAIAVAGGEQKEAKNTGGRWKALHKSIINKSPMSVDAQAGSGPVEVSVIVPARNEEVTLASCLRSLLGQAGVSYEVIVVDDDSTDRTREIAESFSVQLIGADPLPSGWSGKCNACWAGAKVAQGKWLLFTDADTRHTPQSIASGLREAEEWGAAMLSYSPKQEVHGVAERALMPVIFAELAVRFRPKEVSDPASPAAAANGQYLLVRRDAYVAVGGHAAVAKAILEDVELARRLKDAGCRLKFRQSDVVSTRMYRSFSEMSEGWTKNLALLFPDAPELALRRTAEFALLVGCVVVTAVAAKNSKPVIATLSGAVFAVAGVAFVARIKKGHFNWISRALALFGLPLFSALLLRSYIRHKRGEVQWKGRTLATSIEH